MGLFSDLGDIAGTVIAAPFKIVDGVANGFADAVDDIVYGSSTPSTKYNSCSNYDNDDENEDDDIRGIVVTETFYDENGRKTKTRETKAIKVRRHKKDDGVPSDEELEKIRIDNLNKWKSIPW